MRLLCGMGGGLAVDVERREDPGSRGKQLDVPFNDKSALRS